MRGVCLVVLLSRGAAGCDVCKIIQGLQAVAELGRGVRVCGFRSASNDVPLYKAVQCVNGTAQC